MHSQFPGQQTPILIGAESRTVFGNELAEGLHTATVLQIKKDQDTGEPKIEISVGQAYGISRGLSLLFILGETRSLTKANQVAIARLSETGSD